MPIRAPQSELVRLVVGGNTTSVTVRDNVHGEQHHPEVILDYRYGTKLSTWLSYEFNNDLFTPADTFSFKLGLTAGLGKPVTQKQIANILDITRPDTVVRLEIGPDHDLGAIGIIDDQYVHEDKNGGYIELSGRDGMSILQDNESDLSCARMSNTTLPELTARIVEKYYGRGIPFGVYSDNNSNRDILTGKKKPIQSRFGEVKPREVRTSIGIVSVWNTIGGQDVPTDFVRLPIEEARPHPGESEYTFLERHASNLGVMMWMSADGNIVFSRPDYQQAILFNLRRFLRNKTDQNNILSGGARRNTANCATRVKLLGHTSSRSSAKGDRKVQLKASVDLKYHKEKGNPHKHIKKATQTISETVVSTDYNFLWPRLKVIRDSHAKTIERARKEAHRALSRANTNLLTLEYEVKGHSQNGILYCPDTLCQVTDEACNINGVFYITSRSIYKDREGTHTKLKMVPKGVIVLE